MSRLASKQAGWHAAASRCKITVIVRVGAETRVVAFRSSSPTISSTPAGEDGDVSVTISSSRKRRRVAVIFPPTSAAVPVRMAAAGRATGDDETTERPLLSKF